MVSRRITSFLISLLACQCLSIAASTVENEAGQQIVVTIANPVQPGSAGAASTWRGWNWTGGYRVSGAAIARARSIARDYGVVEVDAWPISVLGEYCLVYLVAPDRNRAEVIAAMSADRRIRLAQPLNIFATTTSEDRSEEPYRNLQHGLADLDLGDLHKVTTGRGVRVAVVDTGAQFEHPDIRRNVAQHADFVRREGDAFADDVHGTAIAGVIAATANNHGGIVGVAPDAQLLLLKACWPVNEGAALAQCNSFTLARAIMAARDMEADIINLSLGGPHDPLLTELLDILIDEGITVVGAEPVDELSQPFPSSVDGVVAVRSAQRKMRKTRVSVPAPGVDIITTVPAAEYRYLSGNSLAVAHVSGIIALLRQLDSQLTPARVADLLYESVTSRESSGASISACDVLSRIERQVYCKPF